MSTAVTEAVAERPGGTVARVKQLVLSPQGGVTAIVLIFLAISAWWLTRDVRMINLDNAKHVNIALQWRTALKTGDLLGPLRTYNVYPPGTHIVGALGALIFGARISAVVMAHNLVFVPLLALGCYGAASVAFDRRTGLLAALFAFAAPMVISLFHQGLPDAPLTATVALTVWLLLASERFSRVGVAAAAGVAAGLGMYTKSTFALFVIGLIAMLLVRGGWRNPKGFALFSVIVLALTAPYYVDQFSAIEEQTSGHLTAALPIWYGSVPYPDRASVANFTWYFWNLVNNQLLLPLTLFFLAGAGWALARIARAPRDSGYLPELLAGGFVGYFAVSLLVLKDPRYTLPCLVYVALLGTAWIAQLERRGRMVMTAAFVVIALFNTAMVNLGVGGVKSIDLPMAVDSPIGQYKFTLTNQNGYFAGKPSREGEPLVALLDDLVADGMPIAIFDPGTFQSGGYHLTGLALLSLQSKAQLPAFSPEAVTGRDVAWIVRAPVKAVGRPPCLMSPLADDGTGIYVYRGRVPKNLSRATTHCP